MSVSFNTANADRYDTLGAYGPLDEIEDMYAYGDVRRLDPSPEDALAAGYGPSFSNTNAVMVLQHLGIRVDPCNLYGEIAVDDLDARCLIVSAVGGEFDDSGMPSAEDGGPGTGRARMIECGLRPGYFADAVDALRALCAVARSRGENEIHYA